MTEDRRLSNRNRARRGEEPTGIRELRQEVSELRRANERGTRQRPSTLRPRRSRRRLGRVVGIGVVVIVLAVVINGALGSPGSFAAPSNASLAGMSVGARIVAIANSQIGYSSNPNDSYCNKFSAYWDAGTAECPSGELSEEWCADFAAWAWRKAGVQFNYGYNPGDLNAGAVSFYEWGLDHGEWHPATSGYVAAPGDVAVYGILLSSDPSAAHVAIVTGDPRNQKGPDVINGDGDRTGFSVVETGTDQTRADAGHHRHATLAGYVSPT